MSTAAIDHHDYRLYDEFKTRAGDTPDMGGLIRRLLAGTSGEALEASKASDSPSSRWMTELWSNAASVNTESAWRSLPEDVFDRVDDGDESLGDGDVDYLVAIAAGPDTDATWAIAAIRLLGLLGEERLFDLGAIVAGLIDALEHRDHRRRLHAAEALWQAHATSAVQALERARERETEVEVKATLDHALSILR